MMGVVYPNSVKAEIIRLRQEERMTIDQIATHIGCSRSLAHNVIRNAGLMTRPVCKPPIKRTTVRGVLDRFDVVTVERGATGGYIATIDDAVTGDEQRTPGAAMRDAVGRIDK